VPEIALSRARGYVCSSLDPVTGGKHCAIGGSAYDFIVTSTLASQAPPAVGRALAIPLSNRLLLSAKEYGCESGKKKKMFPSDAISYVSFGEGSVNNAHFLSALNLAKYSQHRGVKVRIQYCRAAL
jgi:2-oxoisovalerate dehydrogenase E1 component